MSNQGYHKHHNADNPAPASIAGGGEHKPTTESLDERLLRPATQPDPKTSKSNPSLDPYVGKLERFELFSTNQCYYLVACDKQNSAYRVLKMDRTLIERPPQGKFVQAAHSPHRRVAHAVEPIPSVTGAETPAMEGTHKAKPTLRPLSDFLTEDPHIYSQAEIEDMLDMIHHGNRFVRADGTTDEAHDGSGGLKPMVKAYGIVGFVRFLDCYYLTLITRRAKVGSIGGNAVYTIKNTETFPLKPAEKMAAGAGDPNHQADPSSMLINMWNKGKRSVGLGLTQREIAELRYQGLYQVVDLTKNFYFSYTYDLTRSLQEQFLITTSQPFPPPPAKDTYAWNHFLTRELEACTNSLTSYHWVMPIAFGAFIQRKLTDYGRSLNLILIARRSRHFAGTRYLKRGVSEKGKVANDVEHEQILQDETNSTTAGIFSSYLQVRGSIPTFWTQESSVTMPKPPIELNRVDPSYRATQMHFEDLLQRYGSPVVVLDLVKQSEKREREVRVGNEFRHAVDYVNTTIDDSHKIRYCALDYSHISKHRNLDVSTSLTQVSTWSVNQTGFFCSAPRWKIAKGREVEPYTENDKQRAEFLTAQLGTPVFPMEQCGVLRTNCIDCLDRTNVAQFSAGVEALQQQLVVMGIRSSSKLDPSSSIIRVLIEMYVEIGDHIALQYGGSEAHKKVSHERNESSIAGPMGKHKELLTSIRRYYSNAFTDRLKQDAMNLFLGYYVPFRHTVPLWEMETDYYLHNSHDHTGRGNLSSMKAYEHAFGINWDGMRTPGQSPAHSRTSVTGEPQAGARRIQRIRQRCDAQNRALSTWWKVALQKNIQQRMWMQLDHKASESLLPSRFDRLYHPDKLAQFDRFFARDWAVPVRRSHEALHGPTPDDDSDVTEYRRTIPGRVSSPGSPMSAKDEYAPTSFVPQRLGELTLRDYLDTYGFEPHVAPRLQRFIEPFENTKADSTSPHSRFDRTSQMSTLGSSGDWNYIGQVGGGEDPPDLYKEYVTPSTGNVRDPSRKHVFDEFRTCLRDTSLASTDVDGIRKLAESAHIDETLRSGPYRGLPQSTSAVDISTVIQEQFNVLSTTRHNGDPSDGLPVVDMELRRRGVETPGVKEAVAEGWDRCLASEKQYAEIVDNSGAACRRSDLTSEESLRLYASFFVDSTPMSKISMTFMLGGNPSLPGYLEEDAKCDREGEPVEFAYGQRDVTVSFVERAAQLGIHIPSGAEIRRAKAPQLFSSVERRGGIPSGFEQINEDLFARKDNKFIVCNGAAMDSWNGAEPVTKLSGIEEDILLL